MGLFPRERTPAGLTPRPAVGAVALLSLLFLFPITSAQLFDAGSLDTSVADPDTGFLGSGSGIFDPKPAPASAPAGGTASDPAPSVASATEALGGAAGAAADAVGDATTDVVGDAAAPNPDAVATAAVVDGASDAPETDASASDGPGIGAASEAGSANGESDLDAVEGAEGESATPGEEQAPDDAEQAGDGSPSDRKNRNTPGLELLAAVSGLAGVALWRRRS